jgi:hypothetical protein
MNEWTGLCIAVPRAMRRPDRTRRATASARAYPRLLEPRRPRPFASFGQIPNFEVPGASRLGPCSGGRPGNVTRAAGGSAATQPPRQCSVAATLGVPGGPGALKGHWAEPVFDWAEAQSDSQSAMESVRKHGGEPLSLEVPAVPSSKPARRWLPQSRDVWRAVLLEPVGYGHVSYTPPDGVVRYSYVRAYQVSLDEVEFTAVSVENGRVILRALQLWHTRVDEFRTSVRERALVRSRSVPVSETREALSQLGARHIGSARW